MSTVSITVPAVVCTLVICALKLVLYYIDKKDPPLGAEITSIVDSITNLHQKLDTIIPPAKATPSSGPISIKVIPL